MNAAFLLVTSACFAGQTPAPAGAPPVAVNPAPIVSTANPGGYGGGCDTCSESGRHRLFGGGGGGLFHRGSSDGACGCAGTVSSCNSCGSGHGRSWSWHSSSSSCCTPTTTTTSCDSCGGGHGGGGFLARCRGKLGGHGSSACDGGCGTVGCATGGCASSAMPGPAPVPAGEVITTPPKKMPVPKAPPTTPPTRTSLFPAPQGITITPTPAPAAQTPVIVPAPTAAPIIEVVPPTVPAVPSNTTQPRSPF